MKSKTAIKEKPSKAYSYIKTKEVENLEPILKNPRSTSVLWKVSASAHYPDPPFPI